MKAIFKKVFRRFLTECFCFSLVLYQNSIQILMTKLVWHSFFLVSFISFFFCLLFFSLFYFFLFYFSFVCFFCFFNLYEIIIKPKE